MRERGDKREREKGERERRERKEREKEKEGEKGGEGERENHFFPLLPNIFHHNFPPPSFYYCPPTAYIILLVLLPTFPQGNECEVFPMERLPTFSLLPHLPTSTTAHFPHT